MSNAPEQAIPFNWREHLPVHPAADLFPLMSEPELRELGEDIKANGLLSNIVVCDGQLLDGRNRLDAMALAVSTKLRVEVDRPHAWITYDNEPKVLDLSGKIVDPYAYVVSANLHRRHLTAEQKRQLIADLLKANPEASDRQIAKQINSSPTTVGAVRKEKEASGDVSKLDTRKDSRGRRQPSAKPKKVAVGVHPIDVSKLGPNAQAAIAAQSAEIDIEARKAEMAKLDVTPEQTSTEALRDFKTACETYLPRLNKADAAQARVFFNEWTAKAVKAEAKAKHVASETAA